MAIPIGEAREEIPNIDCFCKQACIYCSNDWFCPSFCDTLEKAIKMDFELLVKCYARNEGDWSKIFRYIKRVRGGISNVR